MEAPLPPNIEQMKTMHGTGNRRRARRMPQRLIPQMPLRASRITHTSRLTHGTNTLARKCRLNAPHNATDGQHGMTNKMMSMPQHCQLIDTMTRRLCLLVDTTDGMQNVAYCCPLNDTLTRGTQRDE